MILLSAAVAASMTRKSGATTVQLEVTAEWSGILRDLVCVPFFLSMRKHGPIDAVPQSTLLVQVFVGVHCCVCVGYGNVKHLGSAIFL